MSRYVGNGDGAWLDEDVYLYVPSGDDRLMARDVAEGIAERRSRNRRTGYGSPFEAKAIRYVAGFLGEIAALHPIGSGPEIEVWEGSGWQGRADLGRLEVRTTSSWQLYGFARSKHAKQPGLGGWRITAKDRGRQIVCVEDRGGELLVLGWCYADEVPRLREPLGAIIAVVEPTRWRPAGEPQRGDLRPLSTLEAFAFAFAR